jgi:prepilin-type N-terminal cleavage/methylation domain-containing protein
MLRIGKLVRRCAGSPVCRCRRGFTLIEVMVATALLSLTAVMLYESYFMAMTAAGYYERYLKLASWMDEKVWEVSSLFKHSGTFGQTELSGTLPSGANNYTWNVDLKALDEENQFYKIQLAIAWDEGKRHRSLSRTGMSYYYKKE